MQFLKKRNSGRLIIPLMIVALLIGIVCLPSSEQSSQSDIGQMEEIFSPTKEDLRQTYEEPVRIDLSAQQEEVVITEGGDYLLSGESSETLSVKAEDQIVHLFLDHVSISTSEGPAIHVESAGKVVITLLEGTENVLADAPVYAAGDESKAALYSVCDLTVNGTGSLSVYGYYEDAVYSKDVLKILQADVTVRAKRDGLRGSDGVLLQPAKLQIETEGSGVVAANTGKKNKGAIDVAAGEISIIAGKYGIETPSDLYIHDCQLYNKGVIADYLAEGSSLIDERCYIHE